MVQSGKQEGRQASLEIVHSLTKSQSISLIYFLIYDILASLVGTKLILLLLLLKKKELPITSYQTLTI